MKKTMHRWVTIYLPNGNVHQYCTKDLGDRNIHVVTTIECDPGEVKVSYLEDGKVVGRAYSGMQYSLEMWETQES